MGEPKVITLHKSAAEIATGNSSAFPDPADYAELVAFVDVTAVSGTIPVMDLMLQAQDTVSGKWFNITDDFTWRSQFGVTAVLAVGGEGDALRFTTAGSFCGRLIIGGGIVFPYAQVRARWLIGGTGPSFTFTVACQLKRRG